jgi:hypothetical protein
VSRNRAVTGSDIMARSAQTMSMPPL